MDNIMNKKFWLCALGRCIRTMCQTMVSLITVGQLITEVNWLSILSVSATAGIVSLLTSITVGIPEAEEVND